MPDNGAAKALKPGLYGASFEIDAPPAHRLIDRSEIDTLPALMDSLFDSIARLSHYSKPAAQPRVSKVSRSEIERTICSGPCQVKAWHVPGEGIFLDDSLTPETDLTHRSILLHELVHYLQDLNGEGASMNECERWLFREREAYNLQNDYLALAGGNSSYRMLVSNQSWLASNRSTCHAWRRGINAAQ